MRGETANHVEHQPNNESEGATRTLSGTSMPLGLDDGDHFGTVIQTYAAGVEE